MTKPAKWYSIRRHAAITAAALAAFAAAGNAEPPKASAEILIYGEIGESWWSESVSAAEFVRELQALDVDAITVRINSIGGSCPDGIAIYNAIKRHKATITTVVDGMALSVASLIMCAGDVVQMAENATLMVHAPWTYAAGNAVELREIADQLDTWAKAMSTSYAAKSGKAVDDALALLSDGKDHWYTAEEAKAEGFVDDVISAAPPAAMASADLSRFRDVPARVQAALAQSRSPSAASAANPSESSTMPQANNANPQAATTTQTPAAQPDQAAAVAAAQAEGVRAEAQRRSDIEAAFERFNPQANGDVAALMARCLKDTTVTAAAAKDQLLAVLGRNTTPAGADVRVTEDERDKRVNAGVQALMARASVRDRDNKPIALDTANPFRGMTLLEIARASLARAGVKTDGMDKRALVAAAFTTSTSDFPILLENTMHKTLQAAYATAEDTWRRFCAVGSVSDFRAHKRYRVGGLSNLEAKTELGEYRNKTIPDGEKATITAGTKGNIINISRESIINDDLGAFVGLSAALGRAAKRTIEADVYALLALNTATGPTLDDGVVMFHADHANIAATGGAPTVEIVDAMRQQMAKQMDVNSVDYLDLRPALWLGPLSLGGKAREINGAEYNDDSQKYQRKPNIVRGLFRDVVDTPRLSGTRWYMFADPSVAPVIEVAFLDGVQEPFLEMEEGFDTDGARWKVRLDYGVAGVDFRGAVTNAGA
jgi:ATP-dependent protease ClpP protease subunit